MVPVLGVFTKANQKESRHFWGPPKKETPEWRLRSAYFFCCVRTHGNACEVIPPGFGSIQILQTVILKPTGEARL